MMIWEVVIKADLKAEIKVLNFFTMFDDVQVFSSSYLSSFEVATGCVNGIIRIFELNQIISHHDIVNRESHSKSVLPHRELQVAESEPIISIHEASSDNSKNLLVLATLNAVYYLVNHKTKHLIAKYDTNKFALKIAGGGQATTNSKILCHYMRPYKHFDLNLNPFLVAFEGDNLVFIDISK
jgi:hypothetical protein